MSKRPKVKVVKNACGSLIAWGAGKRLRSLHNEAAAGEWLTFMVSEGLELNTVRTDFQPSGVFPSGLSLRMAQIDLEEVRVPHRDKGKSREQIEAEAGARRVDRLKAQYDPKPRRDTSGDTASILRLLMSYGPDNPYTFDKFNQDFKVLNQQLESQE